MEKESETVLKNLKLDLTNKEINECLKETTNISPTDKEILKCLLSLMASTMKRKSDGIHVELSEKDIPIKLILKFEGRIKIQP